MDGRNFMYPGKGKLLQRALITTANIPLDDTTIANGEYSRSIAAHDCKELSFLMEFAADATGDMVLHHSSDPAFAHFEVYETLAVVADRTKTYSMGLPESGHFRWLNSSGQIVSIYAQKRIK